MVNGPWASPDGNRRWLQPGFGPPRCEALLARDIAFSYVGRNVGRCPLGILTAGVLVRAISRCSASAVAAVINLRAGVRLDRDSRFGRPRRVGCPR